jgi:thiol-disulfide isomerase/thioredoxin
MSEHPDLKTTVVRHVGPEALKGLKKPLVVYIYAPWCPHCQVGLPEYDKAVAGLPAGEQAHCVAVNATKAGAREQLQKLLKGFELQYFPTVLGLSVDGRVVLRRGTWSTHSVHVLLEALKQT